MARDVSAPYVNRIEHVECGVDEIDAKIADYLRGWRLTHVVPPLVGQSTVSRWHLFFQRETEDA